MGFQMSTKIHSHLNADGSFDRSVIMQRAWVGYRIAKGQVPFANKLRIEWQRAKMQKQVHDEMNRRAVLPAEELVKTQYYDAMQEAYATPLLCQRAFNEKLAYANSINPWRAAA